MSKTYDCPRCKVSLNAATYESSDTLACGTCSGYWIPAASLRTILTKQDNEFTQSEQEEAYFPDELFNVATDGTVLCVECGEVATKRAVLGTVLIDICTGHGLWLDTGELKNLQIVTGGNATVRAALLEAVGS